MTSTPPTDPYADLDDEAFDDESRAWRQRNGLDATEQECQVRQEAPLREDAR